MLTIPPSCQRAHDSTTVLAPVVSIEKKGSNAKKGIPSGVANYLLERDNDVQQKVLKVELTMNHFGED